MKFTLIGNVMIRKDAILTLQMFKRQDESFIEIGLINGRYINTEIKTERLASQQFDFILDTLNE